MELVKKIFLVICTLFLHLSSFAQLPQSVQDLQDYSRKSSPDGYSPRLKVLTLTPKGNLHYLFPFYHAFKDEEKFKKIYSEKGYYDEVSQYFSFAEDYGMALQYLVRSYDSVDDATRRKVFKEVDGFKNIEHVDARRYIRFRARRERVIMLNEAYAKPLQRVFALSLLRDLYQAGFRYLAMEMLNNYSNHTLSGLDLHTGYYTAEPVAGELVRTALDMGFKLVSYEDTAAFQHTPNQRDSIQAQNIYRVLQQDTAARILVYAEYAHISKKIGADGYVPMGLAFRNISGIDALTIDQTDMSEESNFGYGRVLYQAYLHKFPLKTASIAMIDNEPVNVTNNDLYDLAVIHPPTSYQDGRPTWLSLDGLRKPIYVKPGLTKSLGTPFLAQAYYQREMEGSDNKTWQIVPADQTWLNSSRKNYLFYLKKGKYTVVFRDIEYHIHSKLDIEVE